MDLSKIYKNRVGDSEAFVTLSSGIVAVVHGSVPMLKDGSELFTATTPGHVQGAITATVGSIATIDSVTNVPSVDLVDRITLLDLITQVAEVVVVGAISNLPAAVQGPGNPDIDSYTQAAVTLAANTANQQIVAAPGANKQIWVYGVTILADTGAGTIAFQDEDDTALTGAMAISDEGGFSVSPSGNFAMPLWKLATNKALEADTVTLSAGGWITYAIVSV